MKSATFWIWIVPSLLALVGFLVGIFRGDSALTGKSVMVMVCAVGVARLAVVGDVFL